ncbi:unnamed protein product [Lasius platythorax]|uniref:Uncharacterized protein n=1 Tax=Lasius platythorax TaxID=488582 RepID=A0AAV2NRE1_9HYME
MICWPVRALNKAEPTLSSPEYNTRVHVVDRMVVKKGSPKHIYRLVIPDVRLAGGYLRFLYERNGLSFREIAARKVCG